MVAEGVGSTVDLLQPEKSNNAEKQTVNGFMAHSFRPETEIPQAFVSCRACGDSFALSSFDEEK